MNWRDEWKPLAWLVGIFLLFYFLPVGVPRFDNAITEGLELTKWYAREHMVLCLLPAFFIAGAIGVFVSQASVMRYLGAGANKALAYGVASVSGAVLAVCSCTVLPLFAGIYRMGAGLGPATAFLYSGPAINVLAIILTARILGIEIGVWRALGAIVFSIVIGLIMAMLFRGEEQIRVAQAAELPVEQPRLQLWQTALYFASMIAILVFANWAKPDFTAGIYYAVWTVKWYVTSAAALGFALMLWRWFGAVWWHLVLGAIPSLVLAFALPGQPVAAFAAGVIALAVITGTSKGELGEWFSATWSFVKQITPLLLGGVLFCGMFLGRPGHEGLIPSAWVSAAVGGNSLLANFLAAIITSLTYEATLTEVPIVQGLLGSGMGQGPALSLLLAGPALSLPSVLVLNSMIGWKKTTAYCVLVVIMATITGMIFGTITG